MQGSRKGPRVGVNRASLRKISANAPMQNLPWWSEPWRKCSRQSKTSLGFQKQRGPASRNRTSLRPCCHSFRCRSQGKKSRSRRHPADLRAHSWSTSTVYPGQRRRRSQRRIRRGSGRATGMCRCLQITSEGSLPRNGYHTTHTLQIVGAGVLARTIRLVESIDAAED